MADQAKSGSMQTHSAGTGIDKADAQESKPNHASGDSIHSTTSPDPPSAHVETIALPLQSTTPALNALRARRAAMQTTLADLQSQLRVLADETHRLLPPEPTSRSDGHAEEDLDDERVQRALVTARGVTREHIRLLHRYNAMRDAGQGLVGLVAEARGVRIKDVMEEFGIVAED